MQDKPLKVHKRITVQNEVFEFDINQNKMNIINQSEYERLHKFYRKKIETLATRTFGPYKVYIPEFSVEDIVQELSVKLAHSVVKYDPEKTSFNTFFWRNCLNHLSDLERVYQHSRQIKKYEGTDKAWLAESAKSIASPQPLEPEHSIMDGAKEWNSDDVHFDGAKHVGLACIDPHMAFLLALSDYVLANLLKDC